jgi:hypothetical protein
MTHLLGGTLSAHPPLEGEGQARMRQGTVK